MVPIALGKRILFHHLFGSGWVFVVAVVAVVLIVRFWPAIVAWLEERFSR